MTIKQHANTLPPDIRSKFFKNMRDQRSSERYEDLAAEETSGLRSAVNSAFSWARTPEGRDYWTSVAGGINPATNKPLVLSSSSVSVDTSNKSLLLLAAAQRGGL